MKLKNLLKDISFQCNDESLLERDIADIKIDHRNVGIGDVFIAIKGGSFDGNYYVDLALSNGAAAIISDELESENVIKVESSRSAFALMSKNFFGGQCDQMKIIALTGTNGKTSVCNITADILRGAGRRVGVIGTLGAKIDDDFVDTGFTTPDPYILHSLFREMKEKGCKYVVMEASAHAIALNKLDGIKFEISVLTNITEDHLDFFKTMDNYAASKIELFKSDKTKLGLYCDEKDYVEKLKEQSDIPLYSYGFNEGCDYQAVVKDKSFEGTAFEMIEENLDKFDIKVPLIGGFNIENTLAAVAVCKKLGLTNDEILKGLESVRSVEGRFNIIKNGDVNLIVDFAHTPDGLEKVLVTAKELAKGKLVVIFGCGGNRDRLKRPIMGAIASKYADEIILTSDNPRYENPFDIIDEIKKGVTGKCHIIENRREAIEFAIKNYTQNETIIIAGKGAEKYQEINGVKYPYNDFDVIEECLK